MNDRVLKTLEFDKIIEQLKKHAASSLGAERAGALLPAAALEEVRERQAETREGVMLIQSKGTVPLGGIHDIRPQIQRARIGGTLSPQELLDLADTLSAGRRLKRFVESAHETIPVPVLHALSNQIEGLKPVEDAIREAITEHGEVADHASPELRRIRQQIRNLEAGIKQKLEQILRTSSYQKMIQEAVVTIRNDRYVIPIKQEYRSYFGGIVHDQSASGATLFVEPQAVVAMNNQLREVRMQEEREIERILRRLSQTVGAHAEALSRNVQVLADLDFIFAKAKYALELHAHEPLLNDRGVIRLVKARHPLISPDQVVPIDVELGNTFTMLVITGPNTGGKTVSLKTVGLLTLMAQAGLHIPAEEGSEVAVFDEVFADIGDEQSIEQSLSTFSSHMTNIIGILNRMTPNSLILLDELGAGTDPTEGAALAMAILDHIHQTGARVIATTHYSELKAYAYNRDRVMNASVEFDVETLSPTYRLLIGVPGRSNAFAIAARLGLDPRIIDKAKKQIDPESQQVESMLASLETDRRAAEDERRKAEALRQEIHRLKMELERERERLDKERETILEKARIEARELVRKAKAEAEQIIQELRRLAEEEAGRIKEHKLIEARKRLEMAVPDADQVRIGLSRPKGTGSRQKIHPGDEVLVLSLGMKGTVVEAVGEEEFLVQVGIMKMKVHREALQVKERSEKPVEQAISVVKGKRERISPELDLRGLTVEEALFELDKYLDEAILAGLHQVTIIHGLGTGALRKGVQEYLKNHRAVKSMRLGGPGEGGGGVTIVELK